MHALITTSTNYVNVANGITLIFKHTPCGCRIVSISLITSYGNVPKTTKYLPGTNEMWTVLLRRTPFDMSWRTDSKYWIPTHFISCAPRANMFPFLSLSALKGSCIHFSWNEEDKHKNRQIQPQSIPLKTSITMASILSDYCQPSYTQLTLSHHVLSTL